MNNNINTVPAWGLQCDITPRLGARLVQEGTHLHFLSDRATLSAPFLLKSLSLLMRRFPR